jgi:hypothetical protein
MVNLSILTPTYKRIRELKRNYIFLKSAVLDANFEWIIIYEPDDIATKNFIKKYKEKFIIPLEKRFRNCDAAINYGLKFAKGNYLNFHGDDDYFDKKNFKKIFANLNSKYEWIVGQGENINKNGKIIRKVISVLKKFLLKYYSRNVLLIINFIMTPSTFINRKKFINIKLDDKLSHASDYIMWLQCSKFSDPKIINKILSYSTYTNKTKTGSFDIQRYKDLYAKVSSDNTISFQIRILQFIVFFLIVFLNFILKRVLKIY